MSTNKPPKAATTPNAGSAGYNEAARAIDPVKNPTKGSKFGEQRSTGAHGGVDIPKPTGTPVYVTGAGKVMRAETSPTYGQVIYVDHGNGVETRYAHLSKMNVKKGDTVGKGQQIGAVGSTGRSTGPHLHYEVRVNGVAVDPEKNAHLVNGGVKTDGSQPANGSATGPTAGAGTGAAGQADATPKAVKDKINAEEIERRQVLSYNQEEVIKSLISGKHFIPNKANEYMNLTYHWRLFMTTDTEIIQSSTTKSDGNIATFYEKLNSYEQVTIAESGVTTFSIDEVVMDAICGPNFRAESALFTNIEMKVTEPNGASFLDALRNAALELGVRNYQKCFYYLELTFKGYDESGNTVLAPFADYTPNGGHWVFMVSITDIEVNLTAGGGQYTLKMLPTADTLMSGPLNTVPSTLTPSGSTVGEFMDKFCEQLNNVWSFVKGPDVVKYNVQFHDIPDLMTKDEVRAMSITPKEEDLNPQDGFSFTSNSPTATIEQGFTISRVLDALMAACEPAQILVRDSFASGGTSHGNSETSQRYRQSILWRIESEVHHPNYDPLFNEYYQYVTLHVYGFRNHAAVLRPQDTVSTEETQKAIIADMAKRNFLPKKYEYLFTGVNSDVIDLDLNFNLSWQAVLPSLITNTQAQAGSHARVDPNAKTHEDSTPTKRDSTAAGAKPATTTVPPSGTGTNAPKTEDPTLKGGTQAPSNPNAPPKPISATEAQIAASEMSSAGNAAINLSNQVAAKRKEFADREKKGETISQGERDELAKMEAEMSAKNREAAVAAMAGSALRSQIQAQRPASIPQTNFGRQYGEDLTANALVYESDIYKRAESFPITVRALIDPSKQTGGMVGQYHQGSSVYGAVLNQVYGPLATQFFQISLTIKGDPFWIGASSFEQSVIRNTDEIPDGIPNFSQGSNCFLFRMRYPVGQNKDGDLNIRNNDTVTGIYQISGIQHRFVDGKFTQVISAIRQPLVNLYESLYRGLYPEGQQESNEQ